MRDDLHGAALGVLAAAQAALAFTERGVAGTAFVAQEEPSFDAGPGSECVDQLTVHASQIQTHHQTSAALDPLAQSARPVVILPTFFVMLIRCAPIIDDQGAPSPADQEEAARLSNQDGWVLVNYLLRRARDGSLFAGGSCQLVRVDPIQPIITQGGVNGWRVGLQTILGGFDPANAGAGPGSS